MPLLKPITNEIATSELKKGVCTTNMLVGAKRFKLNVINNLCVFQWALKLNISVALCCSKSTLSNCSYTTVKTCYKTSYFSVKIQWLATILKYSKSLVLMSSIQIPIWKAVCLLSVKCYHGDKVCDWISCVPPINKHMCKWLPEAK